MRYTYSLAAFIISGCLLALSVAAAQPAAPESHPSSSSLDAGAAGPTVPPLPGPKAEKTPEAVSAPLVEKASPKAPEDFGFDDLVAAAQSSQWLWATGILLVLVIRIFRGWVLGKVKWFQSKMGGAVFAFGMTALLLIGADLGSGVPITLATLGVALSAAWTAAGQWGHAKDASGKGGS